MSSTRRASDRTAREDDVDHVPPRTERRVPTWAVFLGLVLAAVALFFAFSGIVMASHFAVAGPVDNAEARRSYWLGVQRWYLLGLVISAPAFVLACVAMNRRSWRRVK